MEKVAIIYLDDGTTREVRLGDILENGMDLIERHIIDRRFFKAYDEYINMLHIIKIKVEDRILDYEENGQC